MIGINAVRLTSKVKKLTAHMVQLLLESAQITAGQQQQTKTTARITTTCKNQI